MPLEEELNYLDHLRQFFGAEVANDELKALAAYALASDIRRLKPAIGQAVWSSRQSSATGGDGGAAHLSEARQLHAMYANALAEYRRITDMAIPAAEVAGQAGSNGGLINSGDSDSTREHL